MKILNNIYDYLSYGKVVYRSSKTGNVIRRRSMILPVMFSNGTYKIKTTKTVLNNNGVVLKNIQRKASFGIDGFNGRNNWMYG